MNQSPGLDPPHPDAVTWRVSQVTDHRMLPIQLLIAERPMRKTHARALNRSPAVGTCSLEGISGTPIAFACNIHLVGFL